jgi:pyridoxine 4-dehydrogenase
VAQLEQARREIDVVSVQNRYNLADTEHDDVLEYCTREGIACIPWLPLPRRDLAALDAVAGETGATVSQVALAWLLQRSPVVAPIPGTSRLEHLDENVAAAGIELSADQIRRLDVAATFHPQAV